jgi:hypothetical protein
MDVGIRLLNVVALTTDIPEANLWRGQVGTVVDNLAEGAAYEVEFRAREEGDLWHGLRSVSTWPQIPVCAGGG